MSRYRVVQERAGPSTGMTTVAVLADPPIEGVVGEQLVAGTPFDPDEGLELYEAMLSDVCRAVEASSAGLLVNYRPADQLAVEDAAPQDALEAVVSQAVDDPDAVRYEVQVGSTVSARVGNTVTHLLETEDTGSVHVVRPTVPLLTRHGIDSASMKLRRSDVVLAPASRGRVGYAGFSAPVNFEGVYDPPAIESLVDGAASAGLEVDFLQSQTVLETGTDLESVVPIVRARVQADRLHPTDTAAWIEEYGVRVVEDGDGLRLIRE